jgi:hypothetical protein
MVLLLCGFGGFFVSQIVKTIAVRPPASIWKMTMALVGSFAVSAVFYYQKPLDMAVYGLAGAGLAVLVHRTARLASVAGDWCIRDILVKRGRG